MTKKLSLSFATVLVAITAVAGFAMYASADSTASSDFEGLTLGTVNAQDGWSSLGAAGSGCAVYDHAVTSSFGVPGFGDQSLRISNAVTSGCFSDQTFSKSLADEAGETIAENGGFSGGTRQNHFEAQFYIRPMQLSQQPGLFMSVSPDRGDGARMSYLGFRDDPDGIRVNFFDAQGTSNPANFVETVVATGLSRAVTHTAKFVIDFVDGPSNDVVKIYIDGVLVHTGTTWENYYRFDPESNPSLIDTSRTVDSLLFRTGGTAAPATAGLGYLIDNLSLESSATPPTFVTVTIAKYVDGVHATSVSALGLSFPMTATWSDAGFADGSGSFSLSTVGFNNPNPYEATTADMDVGANYSVSEDLTGGNVGADCSEGKPFALNGYSMGDDESSAALAATSTSADLTSIATSKWVIVHNVTCPGTLVVKKVLINNNSGVAATTTFSFQVNAGGPTFFEADGENDLSVSAGTFSVVEDAAVGYTTTYSNNQNANADCTSLDVEPGQTVTCTITNDDVAPPLPPPPPADACDTPTVAPAGYTLVNGTTANNSVTIVPFTMFVGKGGNDTVNGPAAGNYIVCMGTGNDIITLGNGNFTIDVGTGKNSVTTGNGDGYIVASTGSDKITTGDGVQTIDADGGNNIILTGNGDKTITTSTGNDNITTGSGADVINAGGGTNTVNAGAGDDSVSSGTGNDTINGGADLDTCNAGLGVNSLSNCEF